jgi:hypothetical protein
VENRILIIGDELFGPQGEVAARCVEMLLCRKPNRPMQFSVNAPVLPSLSQLLARASSDIIGKQAGRIVLGLGLSEMKREGGDASKVSESYGALVDEILKKTQSFLDLVTVPKDLLPEIDGQVLALDDFIRAQADKCPDRVHVLDFAAHAEKFKEMQAERGKFARSLYSDDAKPTSLCLTLLSLFLQDCILDTMK